jgi:hypothetical protein
MEQEEIDGEARSRILSALAKRNVFFKPRATDFMQQQGWTMLTVIEAIIRHIHDEYKIFKKCDGTGSPLKKTYHCSVQIFEDTEKTWYVEIKEGGNAEICIRLRIDVHSHYTGMQLPR